MLTRLAEYIPILSSILAFIFAFEVLKIYLKFKRKFVLWWTIGLFLFGLGTMAEGINSLFGWSETNFRFWFITGALFGGFPLAQGTVYLFLSEKIGDRTTIFWLIYLLIASSCVALSPLSIPADFNGKLSGDVLSWQWTRLFSPFINTYSFIFLFGGAVYSANQYFNQINRESKFIACLYISFGAILPSIGGIYMKIGYVYALYITEFIAILLIYRGFRIFVKGDDGAE
jgi:hypothetical protein